MKDVPIMFYSRWFLGSSLFAACLPKMRRRSHLDLLILWSYALLVRALTLQQERDLFRDHIWPALSKGGPADCSSATGCYDNGVNIYRFDMTNFSLPGSVPGVIGQLTGLKYLNMSSNALTGTMPPELDMTSLETLMIHNNRLDGPLPDYRSLLNASSRCSYSDNGCCTDKGCSNGGCANKYSCCTIFCFTQCISSNCNGCQLSATVDVCSCKLYDSSFDCNNFPCPIPITLPLACLGRTCTHSITNQSFPIAPCLANCGSRPASQLCTQPPEDQLSLFRDKIYPALSGGIQADCSVATGCTITGARIIAIDISNRVLGGSLPSQLGLLTSVRNISLVNNNLVGTFPAEIANMRSLQSATITDNGLHGPFPLSFRSIGPLRLVEQLYTFRDAIFPALSKGPPLECTTTFTGCLVSGNGIVSLNIEGRPFSGGSLPSQLGILRSLTQIRLVNNGLTGTFPSQLALLSSLSQLTITDAGLHGPFPATFKTLGPLRLLVQLYTFRDMIYPALSKGPPLECSTSFTGCTVTGYNIARLSISGRSFTGGSLPTQLGILGLTQLQLTSNGLTGTFPSQLGLLSSLNQAAISELGLHGPFPSVFNSIGALRLLTQLYIFRDNIYPALSRGGPTTECSASGGCTIVGYDITSVSFVNIQLSGSLPSQLWSLTALKTLQFANNGLSGTLPSQLGMLTGLTNMQLTRGNFEGTLPTAIGRLTLLRQIMLHDNFIVGTVPSQLGSLTMLTSINVSHNRLVGPLPSQLSKLSNLVADGGCTFIDAGRDCNDFPCGVQPPLPLACSSSVGGKSCGSSNASICAMTLAPTTPTGSPTRLPSVTSATSGPTNIPATTVIEMSTGQPTTAIIRQTTSSPMETISTEPPLVFANDSSLNGTDLGKKNAVIVVSDPTVVINVYGNVFFNDSILRVLSSAAPPMLNSDGWVVGRVRLQDANATIDGSIANVELPNGDIYVDVNGAKCPIQARYRRDSPTSDTYAIVLVPVTEKASCTASIVESSENSTVPILTQSSDSSVIGIAVGVSVGVLLLVLLLLAAIFLIRRRRKRARESQQSTFSVATVPLRSSGGSLSSQRDVQYGQLMLLPRSTAAVTLSGGVASLRSAGTGDDFFSEDTVPPRHRGSRSSTSSKRRGSRTSRTSQPENKIRMYDMVGQDVAAPIRQYDMADVAPPASPSGEKVSNTPIFPRATPPSVSIDASGPSIANVQPLVLSRTTPIPPPRPRATPQQQSNIYSSVYHSGRGDPVSKTVS